MKKYEILGGNLPVVVCELAAGESMITESGLSATSAGIAEVYFLSPFARCLKIMKLENTQKGKEENEKGKHRCEHV